MATNRNVEREMLKMGMILTKSCTHTVLFFIVNYGFLALRLEFSFARSSNILMYLSINIEMKMNFLFT